MFLTETFFVNTAKRRFLLGALKIFYLSLMVVCFGLATVVLVSQGREDVGLSAFFSMRVKLVNFAVFTAVLFVWYIILSACGFYQSKRLATQTSLAIDALIASTLAAMALMMMAKAFRVTMVSFRFTVFFWLISSFLTISARITIRYCLGKIRRRGRNLRNMLILGTNSRAIEFAKRIEGKPELGYRVFGFVDDDWPGKQEFLNHGYSLCCNCEGFAEYLRHNVIDEVAIYLPLRSFYEHASQVAALCEQHGIIVRFASDIFNLKIARPRATDLDEDPHISAYSGLPDGWPILVKRTLDIVMSFALLILLAPLLAVVAAADQIAFGRTDTISAGANRTQ